MSLASSRLARFLPCSLRWLTGALFFLALVVIVRFLLEITGVPATGTRFLSSNAALLLAAIYLGAVAPTRGVTRLVQLILPSL